MYAKIHPQLLKLIEQNLTWIQRQLEDVLGVSLGKTNYCLKALNVECLLKVGGFFKTLPNNLFCPYLFTPQEIVYKLCMIIHFIKRNEIEYYQFQTEMHFLREELGVYHLARRSKLIANEYVLF